MNAILLASVGVGILLVGGGIGFWVGRSGVGGSKARVEKAEAELEEYKRSVTEHFGETAAHFQAIGKQYRELYEHMATGAQALCESDEAGRQLLFAPGTDASSAVVEQPEAEAVADAERPPIDYAEQPIAEEEAQTLEVVEEPTAEAAAEIESAEADVAQESVPDTAAEPQAEAKAEPAERTIH
ncbi:MAG: YhcB family protein [Gammaproteobacteria bacterium]|nr:YhcB family protein [Gammaproteobacteria bacterium]